MRKIFGITFGGLQRKAISLVLVVLLVAFAVFAGVSNYQNKLLSDVVGETRSEQQQAISKISESTMEQMLQGTMIKMTALQASVADNDFAEIVNNTLTLQSMAEGLFANRATISPGSFSLPDPAMEGTPSAMVLCEEGVDYKNSQYLGIAAHLARTMIAMHRNSDKIDGLYIGLADGTDLCVDEKPLSKLDAAGRLLPFPVRERPWYQGAADSGELYFTGIVKDAFTGKSVVTCAAPVVVGGELFGVVGIDIILESMNDFFTASTEGGGAAFIVNDSGHVLISSDRSGMFPADLSDRAEDLRDMGDEEFSAFVERSLSGVTDLSVITLGGRQYYMAGAPMPTVGWAVISVVDKEVTEQPERQMLAEYDQINAEASKTFRAGTVRSGRVIALMTAALFVLGACAAMYATRRMVRPIEEMTQSIIKSGQTGQLFEMKDSYRTNDEIELLAESFDDLSKKTRRYIENLTEITAEKERVSTELHMANQIQSSMLPHVFPPYPDRHEFDIYASMDPAKEVGGDFYDFFFIDDDHLCLVMADVSGKGIPAALFMMISKTILQSCAMLGQSVEDILNKTNQALSSNNQVEMFVTAWVGVLELSTGKLTAANAGHEYPVICRPDGKFELLRDKHGFVIGGMQGMKYRSYELQLQPGSKLFLYTDGVPEATDAQNKMFGLDRMLSSLNTAKDHTPQQILQQVRASVDEFVQEAEQFDDITMMCIEYKGGENHESES